MEDIQKKKELEQFINERRLPISEYKKLLTDFSVSSVSKSKDKIDEDDELLVKIEKLDLEKECDTFFEKKAIEKKGKSEIKEQIKDIKQKINSIKSESSENSSEKTVKVVKQEVSNFKWNSLDNIWIQKLLSDKFVVKDCLADGNCQFRSIETALTQAGYRTTHDKLRKVIGKYIRKMADDDFQLILENYRLEKESGDFKGNWDPNKTNTKREFINNILKSGFHFEGDNITLSLLSKAIKIDFIIFDDSYNITDLSNPSQLNDKIIILYYIKFHNSGHYNTIGYKPKSKIKTIFKRNELPSEFDYMMDKNKLMIAHIHDIYKTYDKELTLNKVVIEIQKRMYTKLLPSDKKRILLYVKNLLKTQKFFKSPKVNIKPKLSNSPKSPSIKTKSPSLPKSSLPLPKSPKIIKVKRKRRSPNKSIS
jgi:hypothetical protein